MARSKKQKVIYDESLAIEKKEFFVSTKMGKRVYELKKTLESLPSAVKWLLTIIIGGIISGLVGVALTIYFNLGFTSIEEVGTFLKIQFIVDIIIISMMVIFLGLVLLEAES